MGEGLFQNTAELTERHLQTQNPDLVCPPSLSQQGSFVTLLKTSLGLPTSLLIEELRLSVNEAITQRRKNPLKLFSPACCFETDDGLDGISCCFKIWHRERVSTVLALPVRRACPLSCGFLSFHLSFLVAHADIWAWSVLTRVVKGYPNSRSRRNVTSPFHRAGHHHSACCLKQDKYWHGYLTHNLSASRFLSYPKAGRLLGR